MNKFLFALLTLFSFSAISAPLGSIELNLGTFSCNGSAVNADVVVPANVQIKQVRVSAEPTGSGVIRYRFTGASAVIIANVVAFDGPVTDGVLFQPDGIALSQGETVMGEAVCDGTGSVTVRALVYFVGG